MLAGFLELAVDCVLGTEILFTWRHQVKQPTVIIKFAILFCQYVVKVGIPKERTQPDEVYVVNKSGHIMSHPNAKPSFTPK